MGRPWRPPWTVAAISNSERGAEMNPLPESLQGKRLVAYGAGMALLQMQTAMPLVFEFIVDDTPGLAGMEIMGLPVFPSAHLMDDHCDDRCVVIFANTSAAILGMARSLNAKGLTWGEGYADWTVLQYESMKLRLRERLQIDANRALFERVRLLSFYTTIPSLSTVAGTWLFAELLENLRCDGAIAECGVYQGGNAWISLFCAPAAAARPYHLLDSFAGFPALSSPDPASRQLEFRDVDFRGIEDLFRNFENVRIHRGYFHKTLPLLTEEKFAMVYVDCDLYEPTLELCEFFYPRLADGGFFLFHDYWVPGNDPPHMRPFRGVHRAVNEFLGADLDRLIVFPETTHALLIKSR